MTYRTIAATLACAGLLAMPRDARAHAVAGDRLFPVTLTIDDPGVADEASIPTFSWQRSGADGGPGPTDGYTFGFEYDKRITERLGVGVNDAFIVNSTQHDKTRTGFDDVSVTLKYQAYVNPDHELIASVGVIREFGRTGTSRVGADQYGNTTPTVYFGKGFSESPIPAFRPFALTGTLGWSFADRELKAKGDDFNNGYANQLVGGLSLQYSIPYLQEQVKATSLPEFATHLVPLVELSYSSPTSRPSDSGTHYVFAPGVIYEGRSFQLGVEALIPANRASGTHVGVIAQFHLFFDDLLPDSLGKPLFDF